MKKKILRPVFSLFVFLAFLVASTNPVAAGWVFGAQRGQAGADLASANNPQTAATPTATLDATPTQAPTPTATPQPLPSIPPENVLTLEQLGKAEQTLQGPYDSRTLTFSLPSSWQLAPGVQFDMMFAISFSNLSGAGTNPGQLYGGTLTVSFNGATLSVMQIDRVGEQTLHFNIPDKALVSRRTDGRYDLNFSLDTGLNCDINHQVTMILHNSSRMILPHTIVPPNTDLARFPQPFSMDPAWADSALLVVPDQPTAAELQSVLTIGASLKNLTSTAFTFDMITESRLTPELEAANHLILVGKAASLGTVSQLTLPAPITENGVSLPGSNADDGVIEMVASPWNKDKVVLLVSGANDTGVTKASQALSTGQIRPAELSNLAIISSVDPQPIPQAVPIDQTLADLGYDLTATTDRLGRPGTASSVFYFYTATGVVAGPDASFTLEFSHSSLLNFARSGLMVLLNDQPIGSFRFTEESAQTRTSIKFQIPAPALLPGRNRLEVRTDLFPTDNCTSPQLAGLWVTLWPESLLHLPTISIPAGGVSQYDLSLYPVPFAQHPTLGNTAFILPKDHLAAWQTALAIASDMGDRLNGQLITVKAYYVDDIPETVKSEDHLVIVGRPNTMPIVSELHDQLPGPFDTGSEIAIEKNVQVAYRLGSNAKVGYLELLASPWNKERIIMAVLGNSDEGLVQAGGAITTTAQRSRLAGDFAIITGGQITVTDTRIRTSTTVDTTTQKSQSQPEQAIDLTPYQANQSKWILPVLFGSLGLMLVILVAVIINGIVKRSSAKK